MLAFVIGHWKLFISHFQWRDVAYYQSDVSENSSRVPGSERGVMWFIEGTFTAKLNSSDHSAQVFPLCRTTVSSH